ncbi:MAG: transglutaminase domain-containing protein, partial [Clostridia bacterium]|nr:transglutaminase domain-containing protein [Deltaproteobacteria bacterium]
PPVSSRQAVAKADKDVVLTLTREKGPQLPWHLGQKIAGAPATDLEPTAFIQSDDPAIFAAAREAVGEASDVFTATSRLVHFVYSYIEDEYVPAYSNALEALHSKRGDCTEHSVLFVALARSLGIPARVAVGIAYWPPGKGFGWHAWAEVYANGGWYTVDPTWNQPIADVTHVKLASGGPAEQARIVMVLGQLKVVELKI